MREADRDFQRGVELFRSHDYAGAAEVWGRLKDRGYEHANLDLYLTVAHREAERQCRFVESFATELDKTLPDLAQAEVVDAAEDRLEQAKSAIRAGRHEEALEHLEALVAAGSGTYFVALAAARLCLAQGSLQRALEHAELAGRLQPANSLSAGVLGAILLELDRGPEAVSHLKRAIDLDERNAAAWYALGSYYFETKRFDLAESCLRRVLSLRPGWISAASLLDEVERQVGETEKLMAQYRETLAKNPGYADQHHQLGVCLTYQGLYADAVGCFDEALRINPSLVKTLVQRANVLAALDRHAEACRDYRLAISRWSDYDPGLYQEALDLESAGDLPSAAERYAEALRLKPDYASRHIATGRKFLEVGLLEQAEKEIRTGLSQSPQYPDGYCMLGRIALARDSVGEAADLFRKALVLNPLYQEAAVALAGLLRREGGPGAEAELQRLGQTFRAAGRKVPPELGGGGA